MVFNDKIHHAIWAIVPAAGIGRRMQSAIPKQYLPLNGRPVLEHAINALLASHYVSGLVIALQADDSYWADVKISSQKPVIRAPGGQERSDSVLNALKTLSQFRDFNTDTDWVMVHDAVRPCLRQQDIDKLVSEVDADANGGLLALPVRDTMKRQHSDKSSVSTVAETVERDNLWHALTPQYFPAAALSKALQEARLNNQTITDESSAMELAGFSPRLVQGCEDNIKITRPGDLRLASLYLQSQQTGMIEHDEQP
jgi:2-C-methyl-D-erythritol 4-phosphate cytidylyltransferase